MEPESRNLTVLDGRTRRRLRVALCVVFMALAAGASWLQGVGGAVRESGVAVCVAGSPGDLQRGLGQASSASVTQIVTGWHLYTRQTQTSSTDANTTAVTACISRAVAPGTYLPTNRVRSTFSVAQTWFAVDTLLFAPAYALALILTLAYLANASVQRAANPMLFQIRRLIHSPTRRRLRAWVVGLVGAALACDIAENLVLRARLGEWARQLDATGRVSIRWGVLSWLGWAKWAFVAAPLVLAIPIVVQTIVSAGRYVFVHGRTLWVQIVAAGVFVTVANLDQGRDAIRRLSKLQWTSTVVVLVLFGLALALTAAGLLKSVAPLKVSAPPSNVWGALFPGAVVALEGAAMGAVGKVLDFAGLFRFGLAVVAMGVVSMILDWFAWRSATPMHAQGTAVRADGEPAARIGVCLLGVVAGGFGLATISATAADLALLTEPRSNLIARMAVGVALALLAGPLVLLARPLLVNAARWRSNGLRISVLFAAVAAVLLLAGLLKVESTSRHVAPRLGSMTLVAIFLAAFCLIGSVATHLTRVIANSRLPGADRIAVASVLRGIGFKGDHSPVVGMLVLWAVVAASVNNTSYYNVRQQAVTTSARPLLLDPEHAVLRWRAADAAGAPSGTPRTAVFVAASGGGIRSAYWTALVLTCTVEFESVGDDPCARQAAPEVVQARRRALFALSGVSGGSVGLMSYVAAVGAQWSGGAAVSALGSNWVDHALGADFLAPTLGTYLFHDAINALLRPPSGRDRAEALEHSWEAAASPSSIIRSGFFAGQGTGNQPFLLLNGMNVADGCRVLVSAIRTQQRINAELCDRSLPDASATFPNLANTTIDAANQLCPGACDISYATAALLSARFPLITPAGRLSSAIIGGSTIDVVDGGYRENSGASTIIDLLPSVSAAMSATGACVRKVFVQIDNGYSSGEVHASGNAALNQVLAPVSAELGVANGVEKAARQASIDSFTTTAGAPNWFRVSTAAHPGSNAPLGWVLSEDAVADLRAQLALNSKTIDAIRAAVASPGCA